MQAGRRYGSQWARMALVLSSVFVVVAVAFFAVANHATAQAPATLQIIKQVRGLVAPTVATNWNFNITGPTPNSLSLVVNGAGDAVPAAWNVNAGSYSIAENAGANTTSADFTTTVSCTGATNNGTPSGDGRTISGLTIASGQTVVCTFVNTRTSGAIKVVKQLSPPTDPGLFNLSITGPLGLVSSATNVGHEGQTNPVAVATGVYSLVETAGTGTVLSNYSTTLRCYDGANGNNEVPVVDGTVQVRPGQDIACIFLNTRKVGRLIVTKVVVSPQTPDPGRFDLYIGNSLERNDAANGDSTAEVRLNTGLYNVFELAGTGTSLADYNSQVSCFDGTTTTTVTGTGLADVPVNENTLTTCTITNTRRSSTITIIKEGVGGTGTFGFTANGATLPATFDIATTGSPNSLGQRVFTVPAGTHVVTESTLPAGWDFSSLSCNASRPSSSATIADRTATISLADGDNVTCTYTNTRRGALAVTKIVNWNGTPVIVGQTFTICVQGRSYPLGTEAGACQEFDPGETLTFSNLLPDAYRVFETSPTPQQGWLTFVSEGTTQVAPGVTSPVTVTNKRVAGPLVIEKDITGVYTSTYSWVIEKSADPTRIDIFDGDSRDIDYTVDATRTGPVDSDHSLTGEVRITNAGTTSSVSVQQPVDRLSNGLNVPLSCRSGGALITTWPFTIQPQGQILCSYAVDLVPDVKIQGTNGVTVTLANGDLFTGTAPIVWGVPTVEVDKNLSVNDTPTGLSNTFTGSGTWTYQDNLRCEDNVGGVYTNNRMSFVWTNTVSATGNTNPVAPDSASVDVNCYRLTVTKTAVPSLTRTWDWRIDKTVVPTEVTLYEGETATLNYSIRVTNTARVDSGWTVSGAVQVSNPSTMTATLENLTDLLDGVSVDLSASCPAPLVVPPAGGGAPGVLSCNYTASVPDADTVVNQATAVLFGRQYTGTATANFANALVDEVNDSITVTDTNTTAVFGPFTANATQTYSLNKTCEGVTYVNGRGQFTVPNIAKIVNMDRQDNAIAIINCVQRARIIVEKVTVPAGNPTVFDFVLSPSTAFELTGVPGSNQYVSPFLEPGSYMVEELVPAGWTLTSVVCDNEDSNIQPAAVSPLKSITLSPGEVERCVFTNTQQQQQSAALGNYVWDDLDKDGLQDANEPGVPNVTVKLFRPGNLTTPIATTTTDANGGYRFDNLTPGVSVGDYIVQFVRPADRAFTIQNANGNTQDALDSDEDPATGFAPLTTLSPGEYNDTIDAGLVCAAGNISGYVFYDPNGNNVVNAGESAFIGNSAVLPDVRINHIIILTRNLRPGEAPSPEVDRAFMTVTANGRFSFGGLGLTDTFTIRVEDAALTAYGYGPSSSSLAFDVVPTPCGETLIPFGYDNATAGLGDFVWYDVNHNNLQDEWYDADDDGAITRNTIGGTGGNGFISLKDYEFIDLNGNNTPDLEGELNKCGINTTGPTLQLIDPSNAANNDTTIVGNTGRYRFRNHANGPLDPNGTYTVALDPEDAKLLEGAELYLIGDLCKPLPGAPAATVAAAQQFLAQQAAKAAGSIRILQEGIVCGNTTSSSQTTDLGTKPGNIDLTLDFGIVCVDAEDTLTLGDRVWVDINPNASTTPGARAGDGLQNSPAETGVTGVTVELWNPGADNVIGTADDFKVGETATGATGTYLFTGLLPDTYYLVFVKPAGPTAWSSQPNVGSDDSIDSDVTVDPNNPNRAVSGLIGLDSDSDDWDAAIISTDQAGSSDVGDRVWRDINKNGIQDEGEVGVPNIQVQLFQADGTAEASAQSVADTLIETKSTDADGYYLFMALDPGNYYVVFTVPPTFDISPQNAGSNDGVDSDINTAGRTATFALPANTTDLSWDAGIYPTPTNDPEDPEELPNRIFLPVIGNNE